MSKAILVLDKAPENCESCNFYRYQINRLNAGEFTATQKIEFCRIENPNKPKPIARYLEKNKPDWCPLKELPERQPDDPIDQAKLAEKEDLPIDWTQAYCTGWNACYDKISGAED